MAPIVIAFFPKESVLFVGLNILSEVDIIETIRAEHEPTFKDWRKRVVE